MFSLANLSLQSITTGQNVLPDQLRITVLCRQTVGLHDGLANKSLKRQNEWQKSDPQIAM